jgi:hypothetical protein
MPPLSQSDIVFFYLVALTADEIDGFVAHLFDRGVPTARTDAVPLPFSSENPPPLVRVLVSLIYPRSIVLFCLLNRTSILLTKSMRTCPIALVRIGNKLLAMALKDLEYLQLSRLMEISLCTWFLWGWFFSASWTAFRAVRTASWTAVRAVRTAASWLFLLGQQDSSILTAFRTAVSI